MTNTHDCAELSFKHYGAEIELDMIDESSLNKTEMSIGTVKIVHHVQTKWSRIWILILSCTTNNPSCQYGLLVTGLNIIS